MKNILIFLLTICILNSHSSQLIADANKHNTKVLKIVVPDIFDGTGQLQAEPVRRLSRALARQKSYFVFRLIWGDSSPNLSSTATALYNRKKSTLAFYSVTSVGGLGNEGIPNQIRHWKYTGVKPWMIHKIAKRHQSATTGSEDSFLSELSSYGCRRINIQHPAFRRV